MKYLMSLICVLWVSCSAIAIAADGPVGSVKTMKGAASIIRLNAVITAKIDERIFKGDVLRTGTDGSLGVAFKDDSLLSLGPNSEIVIDEFLFAPAEGKLSIVTRMLRGTAAYLSGMVGKLSPESVRFETPVASVGIRGTKLLVKIDEN
jgi:hypothetical protein